MRINRVFVDSQLAVGQSLTLPDATSLHINKVLRMRIGDSLQIFNGKGGWFQAQITTIKKQQVEVLPASFIDEERESELQITLIQGISRGRHMDYTIQKAVELGVIRIIPLITEYSNVHLPEDRISKRLAHWRGIIINACEQCGRNRIPEITRPIYFDDWVMREGSDLKLVLVPAAIQSLSDLSPDNSVLYILSGPEGGLSDSEVQLAIRNDYTPIGLGPRILRTETAAVAAITACQTLWGDMVGQ